MGDTERSPGYDLNSKEQDGQSVWYAITYVEIQIHASLYKKTLVSRRVNMDQNRKLQNWLSLGRGNEQLGTRRVLEHISNGQTNVYGDPEKYSQFVLKENEKGCILKPGKNGGKPLTSFCEEEAGGHGQKGARRMLGAQKTQAKMQRGMHNREPQNCSHELWEVRLHTTVARLRCHGKGSSWKLGKDPRK